MFVAHRQIQLANGGPIKGFSAAMGTAVVLVKDIAVRPFTVKAWWLDGEQSART